MKVLIQRVAKADVHIEGVCVGKIAQGLLLLIGLEKHDNEKTLERMCNKVLNYRIFSDANGKMNLSVKDIGGGVLAISQFTLAAETEKGLRPGFSTAAHAHIAKAQYEEFVLLLKRDHAVVEMGVFGADMQVGLINDGPVTFLISM